MTFQSLQDAVNNGKSLADPVQYAMEKGRLDELFDAGQGNRITLLHYMIMLKSKPGVELLLHYGASPNVRAGDGLTPLAAAIIVREFDLVRLLVEGGAEIDAAEPRQGDTPLQSALIQGRDDIAQYLLDHGANPDARNKLGISPRQVQAFNRLRAVVHR